MIFVDTSAVLALASHRDLRHREARRLFDQGAVTVDGEPVSDGREPARVGSRVRVGKRRWLRITGADD